MPPSLETKTKVVKQDLIKLGSFGAAKETRHSPTH